MTPSEKLPGQVNTIERHILDQQQHYPEATGELTRLLYDIALSGKLIASRTAQAGLVDILGGTGKVNPHGEEMQQLDDIAYQIIYRLNDHTGRLAVMCSEEAPDIIPIPERYPTGKYVLSFDPLDGSSNIDYNVGVGTIFAIHQRVSENGPGTLEDCLQTGRKIIAAGYIFYGPSTMMVYSCGGRVDGFTLDSSIGEFVLSHPDIQIPESPTYFSANLGYLDLWSEGVRQFTAWLQGAGENSPQLGLRYVGSMVADFHRTLLSGGIFYYPAGKNDKKPGGKLRLLYEVNPLAFLMENAGGAASTGQQPVMDILPTEIHQRIPIFVGNKELVAQAEGFIKNLDEG